MIKDEHKVIVLSIAAGLFAGIIDTLVGYFIFREGPFWDLLILDVPVHDLYVRTFLLLSFVLFGYITSRFLAKRKRAEEALKVAVVKTEEEKAKSEAIIAGIGDGISIQDTNFKVLYQNRIHKDFIGDHVGEFCYEGYERKDHVCQGCPVATSFKDGRIHTTERTVLRDDKMSYFEITASPLRDSTGEIIAGIEVVRDVTERKTLEEQLLHAQKMEAVGTLTGGIAHEFNNILTAITMCVKSLQEEVGEDSPIRACIDVIDISTDKAAYLTRSLLTYSRKQVTYLEPVNINEVTGKMERLLSSLIGENIQLSIMLPEEVAVVMADAGQVEQVLMNLVTNARDAMPKGGLLSIRVKLVELDEQFVRTNSFGKPGRFVVLSVTDTGVGMEEKTRERIFEPFFTTKVVGKGTGLGLSTVYGIVKQHDGHIHVFSEPDKGTTFNIYLPEIALEGVHKEPAEPSLIQGGSDIILLAEDDSTVRELLRGLLEKYGYGVVEAVDGEDALKKFMEHRDEIDLMLLDMAMPKRNGREVYGEVLRIRPGAKVLFMSGYMDEIARGADIGRERLNFIPKPIALDELIGKVRKILETKKADK
jgi:PAS domain S-box-containing protein